MHHLLGQSVFDVDGEQAWGETFFVMHAVIGGRTTTGFGRYIDYFRRIDGSGGSCTDGWYPMPPFLATTRASIGNRAVTVPIRDMTG